MASNRATYQQVETVSVKRYKLIDIAQDLEYSKKDLRVFLILLSQLDGYVPPKGGNYKEDPLNFKRIDVEQIADTLSLSKKEVKKSINLFYDEGLIESGSNDTIKNGYRFTF